MVYPDLWAGNRMTDASGASWLIDPSCHWGHREQDLAMMRLFGSSYVAPTMRAFRATVGE